jgi:hypothetical protein
MPLSLPDRSILRQAAVPGAGMVSVRVVHGRVCSIRRPRRREERTLEARVGKLVQDFGIG